MKSVLISIQPKWCKLIAKGKKTVEVRKTAPKDSPFKAYVYCTKKKPNMVSKIIDGCFTIYNGYIIGEFVCDKVEKIEPCFEYYSDGYDIDDDTLPKTCLMREELMEYGKGKPLYGWHISELKIYDKPRELYNFHRGCNKKCSPSCDWYIEHNYTECGCDGKPNITRPPQSWCYVENSSSKELS